VGKLRQIISQLLGGSLGEWVSFLVAALVVLGMTWVFCRIKAWYCDDSDPAGDETQMLFQIRELHREGDLSEEEYRSIKSRLIEGSIRTDSDKKQNG
jgi:uncharacterized membrane protein